MIVHQLFDPRTSSFTYIVTDRAGNTAIIDPVLECFERDVEFIKELKLRPKYILETHIHADHITGATKLKDKFKCEIVVPIYTDESIKDYADVFIAGGDHLKLGSFELEAIHTPGHTEESMCYHTRGALFTGDTLLVRGCGRTDFQNGDPEELYNSIQKLYERYEGTVIIYPGHDYKGRTRSSIAEEKIVNQRITPEVSLEEFVQTMESATVSRPLHLDRNVAANLTCGSGAWPESVDRTKNKVVIAIDVDDTAIFSEGPPFYKNGKPLNGAVEAINALVEKGCTVDFHTARHASLYDLTHKQLVDAGFKFRALHMGKVLADIYIDDRAMRFENWETILEQINVE